MQNIWSSHAKPILALAPMAGYTDPAFRIMCLKHGADVVYTEMISAEGLARQNKKTLEMLKFLPGEKNVVVQLFGTNPASFAKATKYINQLPITGIDINLGCPAKKVYKTGAGAALMDNKKLAREIIKTVLTNTQLPVSIKIRSQVKNVNAVEFIKYIKDLPIAAVMIHGRSLKQMFNGEVNYKIIKQIKKLLSQVVVLANGGVFTPQDAQIILTKTGADGLGIARGAWGQPWIFSRCCHPDDSDHSRRRKDPVINWEFIKKQMLVHAKYFLAQQKVCGFEESLESLRKHLLHYVKGQKNASELRQKIIKVKKLSDLKKI